MGKLGDTFRDGKVVGWSLIGAVALAGSGLGIAAITSANAAPAAVVQTVEPIDFASIPYTNGLAGEQETDAAAAVAAEQARVAAEAAAAEAARVAAEQAAAVEAERIAAEQADGEPASDEPATDDPWASKIRVPWIPSPDPENAAGGDWDMSVCNGGAASTGPDGVPYCD